MSQHKIEKCLLDILNSIERINTFLGQKRDFNEFQNNILVKQAVERNFEIIGEAAKRILDIQPDFKLSNIKQITGLRNRISHAYDSIDDSAIWVIIVNHLPLLEKEVRELLKGNCKNVYDKINCVNPFIAAYRISCYRTFW